MQNVESIGRIVCFSERVDMIDFRGLLVHRILNDEKTPVVTSGNR